MSSVTPGVSIGMPVRNCERTLTSAMRSLMSQTFRDWELILLDDGSSDGTVDIARSFDDPRVRVVRDGKSLGLPRRLNQAIDLSRGELFARMDGDDVAYPDRLEVQVDFLRCHPEVDLVGGWAVVFGRNGEPLGKRAGAGTHDDICARPHAGFHMIHPTFLGRSVFFRQYHYRPEAVRCEDQDLLLRSYQASRFANVQRIVLGYREEEISLGKTLRSRRFLAAVMFNELLRRGSPLLATRAASEQAAKAMIDCIAIGSGLKYRLLRHRARPLAAEEREEWSRVWRSVSNGIGQP